MILWHNWQWQQVAIFWTNPASVMMRPKLVRLTCRQPQNGKTEACRMPSLTLEEFVPASPAPTISTAWPVFHSWYPQFHPLAPRSLAAFQHWLPLLLDIICMDTSAFPSSPIPFPLQVWLLLPQSLLPLLRLNFNPVSSKPLPPKAILLLFPVSLPSKSCFPPSQMPIRAHPNSAVQSSPCTNQLFAGSHCQTPPLVSSVSLTAPHTSEPSSSDLSSLLPSLPHSHTASRSQPCTQLVSGSALQLL